MYVYVNVLEKEGGEGEREEGEKFLLRYKVIPHNTFIIFPLLYDYLILFLLAVHFFFLLFTSNASQPAIHCDAMARSET